MNIDAASLWLGFAIAAFFALLWAILDMHLYKRMLVSMSAPPRHREILFGRAYYIVAEDEYTALIQARDVLRASVAREKALRHESARVATVMMQGYSDDRQRPEPRADQDLTTWGSPLRPGQ